MLNLVKQLEQVHVKLAEFALTLVGFFLGLVLLLVQAVDQAAVQDLSERLLVTFGELYAVLLWETFVEFVFIFSCDLLLCII